MSTTATNAPEAPADGIHKGIHMDVYREWPAVAASDLSALMHSPARYRWRKAHPKPETQPMKLGSASHCAVLESAEFANRYRLAPQPTDEYRAKCENEGKSLKGWANTKACREARALLEVRGFELLSQSDLDAARAIQDAVAGHPLGKKIMTASMGTEVSVIATDAKHGLRRKIRPDVLLPGAGMVVDIKTAEDERPEAFARAVHRYAYHRSARYYLDTLNLLGGDRYEHYVFFVVCTTPPHEIRAYTLRPIAMELAEFQLDALLAKLSECEKSDAWPAHGGDIEEIDLPGYAYRDAETEEF